MGVDIFFVLVYYLISTLIQRGDDLSVYQGLWKKEIRMMRGFHILFGLAVLLMWTSLLSQGNWDWMMLVDMSLFSFVIIPVVVLFSLNMERHQLASFLFVKKHLSKQVLIKFGHGLLLYMLYYICIGLMGIVLFFTNHLDESLSHTFSVVGMVGIYLLAVSLAGAVFILLAWVLYQWWRKNLFTLLNILLFFVLFIGAIKAMQWLMEIVSNWLVLTIDVTEVHALFGDGQISLLAVFLFICLNFLIYQVSVIVLRRKVEV